MCKLCCDSGLEMVSKEMKGSKINTDECCWLLQKYITSVNSQ